MNCSKTFGFNSLVVILSLPCQKKVPSYFPTKKFSGQKTSTINKPKVGNVNMTSGNIMGNPQIMETYVGLFDL